MQSEKNSMGESVNPLLPIVLFYISIHKYICRCYIKLVPTITKLLSILFFNNKLISIPKMQLVLIYSKNLEERFLSWTS